MSSTSRLTEELTSNRINPLATRPALQYTKLQENAGLTPVNKGGTRSNSVHPRKYTYKRCTTKLLVTIDPREAYSPMNNFDALNDESR